MKRCPKCLFLYPDSDERCDFDKTALEPVSDAEIDATTIKPKKRNVVPIIAVVALLLFVLSFAVYYAVSNTIDSNAIAPIALAQPVVTVPPPLPAAFPSPTASPLPSAKPSPTEISTSHSRATTDPVSTSGPGIAKRQGGKPVIMLTSGGKIDADEVWRTRDGVWYRRNGMVTLLRRHQVKAIVTR
jgi:hypothetical protein